MHISSFQLQMICLIWDDQLRIWSLTSECDYGENKQWEVALERTMHLKRIHFPYVSNMLFLLLNLCHEQTLNIHGVGEWGIAGVFRWSMVIISCNLCRAALHTVQLWEKVLTWSYSILRNWRCRCTSYDAFHGIMCRGSIRNLVSISCMHAQSLYIVCTHRGKYICL